MSDERNVPFRFYRLKCDSQWFDAVKNGSKTFEVRLNDRGYQAGDEIELFETEGHGSWHTGRKLRATISYVFSGIGMDRSGCGYVVLGLRDVNE